MSRQPFDTASRCPKCHTSGALTRFCSPDKYSCWLRNVYMQDTPHMDRRCQVCTFSWPEKPLDQ